MAAVADLRGKSILSTTSPEIDPVQKKDDPSENRDHNLVPPSEHLQPDPCLQGISSGTAIISFYSTASSQAIAHSASFTSPETDAAQEQGGELNDNTLSKPDPVLNTTADHTHIRQASPRDIPRVAGRSAQHPRTARPFIISPGHPVFRRGRFHARIPNPPYGRLNLRNGPRARDGNQAWQTPRAQQVPQAIPADLEVLISTVDMEEMGTHVLGGLVEASVGCKGSLFAKQVPGDLSTPHGAFKVKRHKYMAFPQPDMGESNREFDRELEECRPIIQGFDEEFIDAYVSRYAEKTALFESMMEEHHEEFGAIYESFLSIKKSLRDLNDTRESAKSDAELHPPRQPRLTPAKRAMVLATVAEAEEQLTKQLEAVQHDLHEIIIRGGGMIKHALRQDFGAANAIDEYRTKALQRKEAEEENTELVTSGAMLGLRGSFKEQDSQTRNVILEHTQRVVDERMKGFGQPYKPGKFGTLTSNLDTLITTVPEWFILLETKGTVQLHGATALDRYKELIQVLGNTCVIGRDAQWAVAERPKKPFTKQYHGPDPGWPNEKQRVVGGWWSCRSGPDASLAENRCKLCHPRGPSGRTTETVMYPSSAEEHKYILAEIEEAMAEANKRDRLRLKHQLQQDQEDFDSYLQQREWRRSGGVLELHELLYGMSINELNHRPSIERSQSWQVRGSVAQCQEAVFGKGVDNSDLPAQRRLSEPIQGGMAPRPNLQDNPQALAQALATSKETIVQAEPSPWDEIQRLFPTHEMILEGQLPTIRKPAVQEEPPVQNGPTQTTKSQTKSQLRSSMARPGQKGKGKSVTWLD
ncbi:hypothetical protein C8A03DRAFT_16977 [Achaetomium macrosporum]|uniref:Uncharacterized protein n=1 Tax=Achaetomium macrosporum TaxID=79813 RepID=A0AAN7C6J3_9PEZI|nr:hypothetical protein C8A03DRAFT_16977 [Achaetomium macrosporum]